MALSVILITKNEEKRLGQALESVRFADEIIILDSQSTDQTEQIAKQHGAIFIKAENWPGFGMQKNKALSYARNDWVLSLDADEWLSQELAAEIVSITSGDPGRNNVVGFWVKRRSFFIDKLIRFGDWQNDKVLRLFRRGLGEFSNDLVHERLEISGPTQQLRGMLFHKPVSALSDSIHKMWRYNLVASRILSNRKACSVMSPWSHAGWSIIRGCILKLGLLDGWRGTQLAWFNAKGVFIRYEAAIRLQNPGKLIGTRRWKAYLHLIFLDHGFLRGLYRNFAAIHGPLYRSNQPSPRQLGRYKSAYDLKTVINLRGANPQLGWYKLEAQACKALGLSLINTQVHSRGLPTRQRIHELKRIIETVELPALTHCKSGADRAGIFCVLYRHFRLNEPIETAKEELHWKYGHFKRAKTGLLDYFFDCYLINRSPGQSFIEWIDTDYDREAIEREFKPLGFTSVIVDSILRRE